jgi:hypothetical protein
MTDTQRLNKIPLMDFICHKSTLFSELNSICTIFPQLFEFYLHTFICGRRAVFASFNRFRMQRQSRRVIHRLRSFLLTRFC